MIGLALFAMVALAVVGTLIQTARLDTKDTGLTETTILADTLLEKRVADGRDYDSYRDLLATPPDQYWELEAGRADQLETRYIYRVDIDQAVPAMKRVIVSVYHRDSDFPVPTVDVGKGQAGLAISVGTLIAEPAR
jgi:hypothetical protein